jgi:lipopolysaccharide biosynthesis regulator YciM
LASDPDDIREAHDAIQQAGAESQGSVHSIVAGRIAYLAKDYPASVDHLQAAVEIWPDMAEAHSRLSATYRTMGNLDKSEADMKAVARIKQEHPGRQDFPFPTEDLLFTVDEVSTPP